MTQTQIADDDIEDGLISGNITTTITDHYAQFLFKRDIKLQHTNKKLFRHNSKNFNDAQFDFELKNTDWNTILEPDKKDIDISFNKFLLRFNNLSQHHAPLKKHCNEDIKTMKKPWITKSIKSLKSVDNKNKIYRKCIRTKSGTKKEKLYELFKTYRNSLNKITKLSKANYYYQFFE